jgi:XTP/dITP diphosphohydrolase
VRVNKIDVRFVSSNKHKIREAQAILSPANVRVVASQIKIDELQVADTSKLVRDKLLKAFDEIGRPLFVEHTGLYLDQLNGLPGGLTQIFWDTLRADRFAELFGNGKVCSVKARTTIAYCDGRKIREFTGETSGVIVSKPRGPRDFQWDCVFQPQGYRKTFAELGKHKNEMSMRRRALDELASYLKGVAR